MDTSEATTATDATRRLQAALDEIGSVPLPGSGATRRRFEVLAEVGAADLTTARLVEGHLDAIAILDEATVVPPEGLLGVWAADPPTGRVSAARHDAGWVLSGVKQWCSGAGALDHALITAHADDGYRLFVVPLAGAGVGVVHDSWNAVGMRASDTFDVVLDDVAVTASAAVGPPGWYLSRRGFWVGGIGVAACWYGGAWGALDALRHAVRQREDPHGLAHLGAADALCAAMWALLASAADAVDDGVDGTDLRRLAWRVRAAVERLAPDVLLHAERGVGAVGVTRDADMARRVADLPVYIRQHRAEADLAALGADLAGGS